MNNIVLFIVCRKQLLLTCVSAVMLLLACSPGAEKELITLKPFSSDGCSLFPDSSAMTSHDWCDCCFQHDIAYWRGGTAEQRKAADRLLRQCVTEKTGNSALAALMYEGVRVGGSPYFHTWYRWGYGWTEERTYQPLTAAENELANSLMDSYPGGDSMSVCKVGTQDQ